MDHWRDTGAILFVIQQPRPATLAFQSWIKRRLCRSGTDDDQGYAQGGVPTSSKGESTTASDALYRQNRVADRMSFRHQKPGACAIAHQGQINVFTERKPGDYVVHEIPTASAPLISKPVKWMILKDYLEIHYAADLLCSGKAQLIVPVAARSR